MKISKQISIAVVIAAIFTAAPGIIQAQELVSPKPHQGYFASLGAYGHAAYIDEEDDNAEKPWFGPTGEFRFGQAVTGYLDLGLAFGMGGAFGADNNALLGHLSLEAQFRPSDEIFIRAGIGFGFAKVTMEHSGEDRVLGRTGGSYTLAVGYEFFPWDKGKSGGVAVTPVVGFRGGPGELVSTTTLFVGIELTWWGGLSKDQLDLPFDEAY